MEPFEEVMPLMPFNPLPLIMIGGFLIAAGIIAFAVIRAYIAFKKSNLTLAELNEQLEKLDQEKKEAKSKRTHKKKHL